jgi:putative aldouronate transport system substrate-binding protein
VGISADGKQVTGVSAYGDPEDSYSVYQAPYHTFEGFNKYFLEASVWNAYVPRDAVMRESSEPLFFNGYAAAAEGTISAFNRYQANLRNKLPQAELGFWPYIDELRDREKGIIALSFRAWNYLCIPRSSTKTDKVFEFLNWIFESKENNDLFSYGLKGVHWDRVNDNSPPMINTGIPEAAQYLFPGYELTWNPRFVRIPTELPDEIAGLFEYQYAPDSFMRNPISGFVFDEQGVITELARIRVIFEKYRNALLCGAYEDPAAVLREMNQEMKTAGLGKLKNEITRQVQGYLNAALN